MAGTGSRDSCRTGDMSTTPSPLPSPKPRKVFPPQPEKQVNDTHGGRRRPLRRLPDIVLLITPRRPTADRVAVTGGLSGVA